jgi:hypothetical protein
VPQELTLGAPAPRQPGAGCDGVHGLVEVGHGQARAAGPPTPTPQTPNRRWSTPNPTTPGQQKLAPWGVLGGSAPQKQ